MIPTDQYLIYLRKSRQDRDQELLTGNFDTLQRHRDALLKLARDRGLTVAGILEEVVTGDTIAERPRMQELLSLVETGAYAGVLVMEVPRLARGNTRDQGIVAETFQYSGTRIITPAKTYDPNDEADEEYFEFGLFMSRREYKTINRRLNRGRLASLNEGKYIAGSAPYGYEKYKLPKQKGYSLRIVPDKAEVVRRIYHLYTVGLPDPDGADKPIGSFTIANQLNAEGVPSPGGAKWTATAVRDILKNPVYAGFIRWSYRPLVKKVIDGKVITTEPVSKEPTIVKGIHEPIISEALWRRAGKLMCESVHAPVPGKAKVSNPLAGVLFCSACGRSMVQMKCGKQKTARVVCPTPGCETVSSRVDEAEAELLKSLQRWLGDYKLKCKKELLAGTQSAKQTDFSIDRLKKTILGLQEQRNRLYDLLEQGVYTNEVFLERSRLLAEKLSGAEQSLAEAQASARKQRAMEHARENVIPELEHILSDYMFLSSAEDKNAMLKNALVRVVYEKTKGGKWAESNLKLYVFPKMDSDLENEV